MSAKLLALALVVLCSTNGAESEAATAVSTLQDCVLCSGDSDSDAANGTGACSGESVTILVTVESSLCEIEFEPSSVTCHPGADCSASVYRTWGGLPEDQDMDFCVKVPGFPRLCLDPPPSSGSGSGTDDREFPLVRCQGGNFKFSISTSCGTTASATANCDGCYG